MAHDIYPTDFKHSEFHKVIDTDKLYISDFSYNDLRSDQLCDLSSPHCNSMSKDWNRSFWVMSQNRLVISYLCLLRSLMMLQAQNTYRWLTSSSRFPWSPWPQYTLRTNFEFALTGSNLSFDLFWWEKHNGAKICVIGNSYLRKTALQKNIILVFTTGAYKYTIDSSATSMKRPPKSVSRASNVSLVIYPSYRANGNTRRPAPFGQMYQHFGKFYLISQLTLNGLTYGHKISTSKYFKCPIYPPNAVAGVHMGSEIGRGIICTPPSRRCDSQTPLQYGVELSEISIVVWRGAQMCNI